MIWILQRAARVNAERQAIATLEESAGWLSGVVWRLETGLQLKVDFTITHDGESFDLTLAYPDFFPDVPPLITSRDGKRLSDHQYGRTGELCLEYRADNWESRTTGATMIESAHRLIAGERIDGEKANVPSAHNVSQGQVLRGRRNRFLAMPSLRTKLAAEPVGALHKATFRERHMAETFVAWTSAYSEGDAEWHDPTVSTQPVAIPGLAVRVGNLADLLEFADAAELKAYLEAQGLDDVWQRIDVDPAIVAVLLADDADVRFIWITGEPGARTFYHYRTIDVKSEGSRLPTTYAALAGKTVGLVGAGSLGSKIAVSLARAGVGRVRILDGDISLPHNMVRNDLDWRSMGQHKVDGLQDRILEVAPSCVVESRRVTLGGQESAAATAVALDMLGECDLIIDATADPRAFNFCAAAAVAQKKPMLWAEVFAGGIGGMIARATPETDPPPPVARRQINAWCEREGVAWEGAPIDYGVEQEDRPPLVASDADVGVIAGHATRLALDALIQPGASAYPASVYLIGLATGWIFREPFDTVPIALHSEPWTVSSSDDHDAVTGVVEFLTSLLPPGPDDETEAAA
jgi:molybdopterin/thiamine biosynthesis adenylyltransferase